MTMMINVKKYFCILFYLLEKYASKEKVIMIYNVILTNHAPLASKLKSPITTNAGLVQLVQH